MKIRNLVVTVLAALFVHAGFAINTVNNTVAGSGVALPIELATGHGMTRTEAKAIQKAEKKQVRTQKRIAMVQKYLAKNMAKKAIDFKDPVNKWLWFGVFGWGAGLVLWILAAAVTTGGGFLGGGFLGLLASLAWLFGTVAFVIWLVKKFGDA